MDVIYLDSLFGLNLLIDYCLVLVSARVCGVVLHRWRYALAALIGALYAALMVLPGFGWLANGMMKLALGAAMALIAFGGEVHLVRCTVVFFAVSAAFGGAVYAASMLAGVSPGSGALVTVSGRVLALSFAACYAAVSLVFRRRAMAADREVRTVTVTLAGRSVTLRALRDSGNDLHDPVSGLPAAVVERAAVLPLFPAVHALPDDAVQALEALIRASRPEDILRISLTGTRDPDNEPNLTALTALASGYFYSASLYDNTTLSQALWARMEEDTITGLFLRAMAQRLQEAAPSERPLLERAVRFGLAALEGREEPQ